MSRLASFVVLCSKHRLEVSLGCRSSAGEPCLLLQGTLCICFKVSSLKAGPGKSAHRTGSLPSHLRPSLVECTHGSLTVD